MTDFNQLFISSFEILKQSLIETKEKLSALAKANVVDAGARGFVLFIEGIIEFIRTRNLKELIQLRAVTGISQRAEETIPEKVDFRFCTEALIKKSSMGSNELRTTLEKYGNSIVVAGSEKMRRLHVHTNNPAELFDELRKTGTLAFQKADDMIRQSQAVYNRKWKIALVTDSTCDLSQDLIDKYQVNMLPININFGENHYLDKITILPEQFYRLLDESPDYPKTSQVNEKAFVNLYSHLASHYDSIISVHLSDKLSGTFNSSNRAAQAISREFGKQVTVINSRNISGALGLLVLRTAKAIEEGQTHEEIVIAAEKWAKNLSIFISVTTMKYLVRGGRVSAIKGLIARLLNVNPVITIDDSGKAAVAGKAFNEKACREKVFENLKRVNRKNRIWNYVVLHSDNNEAATWYSEKMKKLTGIDPVSVINISPVLGAHAGPGAAAVAVLPE
jgi:DegV family protein with EDD domain